MRKAWIILGCLLLTGGCSAKEVSKQNKTEKETPVAKSEVADDIRDVSFVAVGDNLIHGAIFYYNAKEDGTYDFKEIYEHTNSYTRKADIAYINQETICGGTELGLSHYPSFNGPYEVLDAVADAGFDWMAASSNHTLDAGTQGILNQLEYMKKHHPDIKVTGSHATKEESEQLQVITRNDVRFGILGYTYGLNGYVLPKGKEFMIDLIEKDKIRSDVEKLKKVSDVQIVSMHWGTEYSFEPNEEQKELAQLLSDLGVDVIIGEHPHVIQPMDYVIGKDGNKTLVIYSLGNFLSAQDDHENMLGGMARWTLSYNKANGDISFKNVEFLPTVTHIEGNFSFFRTYALKDYTNELAARHTLTTQYQQDNTREYYISLTNKVMNDKVKIVY
ncbi:CapA family protein [[Clostridium] innocuum]|nr:CapA family protein [[Clostridium] innocuum]